MMLIFKFSKLLVDKKCKIAELFLIAFLQFLIIYGAIKVSSPNWESYLFFNNSIQKLITRRGCIIERSKFKKAVVASISYPIANKKGEVNYMGVRIYDKDLSSEDVDHYCDQLILVAHNLNSVKK